MPAIAPKPLRDANQLAGALASAIARAGAPAGVRLASEDELARKLGVGRRQVREAFDVLVENGMIVRRRGSGTYLRRKITNVDAGTQQVPLRISAQSIFAQNTDLASPPSGSGRAPADISLQLSLWSDVGSSSRSINHVVTSRLISQADEGHHRVSIGTIRDAGDRLLSSDQLLKRLEAHPSDGHLVSTVCAEPFMEAWKRTTTRPPVLFFHVATTDIMHDPTFMLDTDQAIRRAVDIFVREGHKRPAALGLDADGVLQQQSHVLREATERCGIENGGVVVAQAQFADTLRALRELLDAANPPDAIYVSDDLIFEYFREAMQVLNLVPGRDIAVITLARTDNPDIPGDSDWSRMVLDADNFGRRLARELIDWIRNGHDACPPTLRIAPVWVPGTTHRRTAKDSTP